MICNDAQRFVGEIADTDHSCSLLDQGLEDVDFIVGVHALHDGGDTLQTHTGIHRWPRQRLESAIRLTIELHEHHVPDLDETIAILFG